MIRHKCLALVAAAALYTMTPVHADSLIIGNIDPSGAALTERPKRGMSMETVESKWGQPDTKRGSVGDPPIARWEYANFVVYFEYSNVIHAVRKP